MEEKIKGLLQMYLSEIKVAKKHIGFFGGFHTPSQEYWKERVDMLEDIAASLRKILRYPNAK